MEDHDDPGRRSRKRIDSPIRNGLEKELSGTSKRFSKGIDEYRPFELKAKDDSEEQTIGEDQFTETIDLTALFSKELSATGSFDIRGEIWESTFGQVLQALPIPVFLIGQDSKIIFANQACSKMSSAYEETQGVLFPTLFPGPGVSGKVELLLEDVFSSRKTKVAQAFLKIKENRIWARFTLRSVRIMRERQILALIEDLTSEKKQIRLKEKFSLELEQRVAERTAALWEAEAALHGSEERFKDLVESTSDWIWERDANGVYTYASPRIKELLGYEPEEVLGKVPSELMPSEKMSFQFDSELQSVVRTGKPFRSWETISERKDGRLVVIESSGVPFFDSTGKLLGYRGIDRDITHRKQTEEALHKSEEKYRLMADNTLDLIWQTDLDLCLTYVNPAIFAVTEYTPDEVIGSKLSDHCDEENFMKMAQVASEEISKGSESSGAIFEAVVLNKNKEPVPIEIRGKIVLDKNGAPIALQGVARDIAYRKQAEDALRNSEEKYRLMADNMLDMIWQTDLDLRFTYVNPAIFAITGYTPDEVIGGRLSDHCDEENFKKIAQAASVELSKGPASSGAIFEAVLLNKNKEPVSVEVHGKIVLDKNGVPIALQGVARDITYRKQAEDALRNSEEIFRTILGTITDGYHETDRRGNLTLVNDSLCEILGYSREELIGINYCRVMDEASAKRTYEAYNEVYRTGKVNRGLDIKVLRKDGMKRQVSASIAPRQDSDLRISGFRGVFREVVERRQLEEQL